MGVLKVVFVIIGTLIGAGFASGQEIYLFFYSYGIYGIIGLIISNILIGIVIYKTFMIIQEKNILTYHKFLEYIIEGRKIEKQESKKKIKKEIENQNNIKRKKFEYLNIAYIMNIIINIFILVTFFIMIAGFGAYLEQEFSINNIVGSSILAILTFIVAFIDEKKFIKINEILIPILIILIIAIGIISFFNIDLSKSIENLNSELENINDSNNDMGGYMRSSIISAIIYASYNSILLIPILITLKKELKSKKQIMKISVLTAIISTLLASLILYLLTTIDIQIAQIEMPMVYVATSISKIFKYIYGFIILCAIFTTSIALQKSFLENVFENKKSYPQIVSLMCITGVITSNIGFSKLVASLYTLFGYLGLIQVIKIIVNKIDKKIKI